MVQNKKAKLGVIAGALLVASTTLFPAQAANSGTLIISVNQSFTSPVGTAVVTGIIGDYGTIEGAGTDGKPSKLSPSPDALIKLKKGTILLDGTNLNKATIQSPFIQSQTCSFSVSGSSVPWDIVSGTGAYKAIKGTLTVTLNLGGITPRFKTGASKGKCDFSNKLPPVASYFTILAAGTVSY